MTLLGIVVSYLKKNRLALALLAVAWVVFFSPLMVGGKIYFLDDLKIIYFPLEYVYAQAQQAWELPIWNNYFGFGQPLLAWGQLGFFTPLHVLLRALAISPLNLLQVSVMGYYALGLAGMFIFLRRHVSGLGAALGSLVFVFSGFHIGHLNHVNFYTATMLLPYLLLAVETFCQKPTAYRVAALSLLAAAMALSGQPQVVTYSFIVATVIGACCVIPKLWAARMNPLWFVRFFGFLLVAAVLGFCLASFAILPLFEFLPFTDRGGALPEVELFEFSYPPWHAITLIFPYFFGDHDHYVGPKGFQELAAFVGILPLLLGSLIFCQWKKSPALRVAALLLGVSGVVLALGSHSVLYTWLVHAKIITSIAIPGRFVFFFDIAIALSAALGLDTLMKLPQLARRERLIQYASLVVLPLLLSIGFLWQIQTDTDLYTRLLTNMSWSNPAWGLLWLGVALLLLTLVVARYFIGRWNFVPYLALVIAAGGTLLTFGWDYNPRTDRKGVDSISPFIETVRSFGEKTGLPARLYAAETILAQVPTDPSTHRTERIGPDFSVYQAITVRKPNTSCIEFPARINQSFFGTVRVTLQTTLTADPFETIILAPTDFVGEDVLRLCFNALAAQQDRTVFIGFIADYLSPLELLYVPYTQNEEPVYFVRKQQPTSAQLAASQKPARLLFNVHYPTQGDLEAIFLARHLHVLANASSARWISALSIGNYRDFVENFFANDRSAIDGDGVHALVRFRNELNMAGVTHLIQTLPLGADDGLLAAGYDLLQQYDFGPKEVRLYANPAVLPKAFFVDRAVFKPAADETRYAMQYEPYVPTEVAYVTGAKPPPESAAAAGVPLTSTATVTAYEPLRVDVATETSREAMLVLTDSTLPQWQTYIDDQPAPYYVANTVFKAALVPAGKHTVSFRYHSPAISLSKKLTLGGLVTLVLLLILPQLFTRGRIFSNSRRAV